jgi:hypothetical protein
VVPRNPVVVHHPAVMRNLVVTCHPPSKGVGHLLEPLGGAAVRLPVGHVGAHKPPDTLPVALGRGGARRLRRRRRGRGRSTIDPIFFPVSLQMLVIVQTLHSPAAVPAVATVPRHRRRRCGRRRAPRPRPRAARGPKPAVGVRPASAVRARGASRVRAGGRSLGRAARHLGFPPE